ncbi:hypothetical protein RJ498_001429 [Pluralibacter gergoviae]
MENVQLSKLVSHQRDFFDLNAYADENCFHIIYGADDNFHLGMAVSMLSVLENNKDVPICFHIFTNKMDDDTVAKFETFSVFKNCDISVYFIDERGLADFPLKPQWTCAIYFRIIAIDYLSTRVEKVLYIDADVLCMGSITPVFETNLIGNIVGACFDDTYELSVERSRSLCTPEIRGTYFNAGLMVIDCEKWIEYEVSAAFLSAVADKSLRRSIIYCDQDLLNIAVAGRVALLDQRFNYQYFMGDEYKQLDTSLPAGVIFLHYIGPSKPWHEWASGYKNSALFQKVKCRSPWKDAPFSKPHSKKLYTHAARHAWHQRKLLLWAKYRFLLILTIAARLLYRFIRFLGG